MDIFLDNFHQGGEYSSQIARHKADLRIEGRFNDQKYLSITYLHNDHLNIDRSSGSVKKIDRKNLVQKNIVFVKVITILQRKIKG